MTEETVEQLIKVIDKTEEAIIAALSKHEILTLCTKMEKKMIINSDKKTLFYSLDHSRLDPELLARYLLRLVSERIRENKTVWRKFLNFLNQIGEREICDRLKKLSAAPAESQSECLTSEGDIILSLNDVSFLVNLMTPVLYKYEELGLALNLPEYKIKQCTETNFAMKLSYILTCWISEDRHTPPSTTLSNLKVALRGDIVAENQLANDLEKKCLECKKNVRQPSLDACDGDSNPILDITEQSIDTEVEDGKSTLLHVLASPRESVCYQWQKDGQPLANDATYSGVSEDILVISCARQGTEGEYTCCLSLQDKQMISNEINLEIFYTKEKKRLLDLYSEQNEVPKDTWPPKRTKTFINLFLKQQQIDSKGIDVAEEGMISKYEGKTRQKISNFEKKKFGGGTEKQVRYEDLFENYQSGSVIVIEGCPGSGKTTLVHKLVIDWSKGTILKDSELVFLITLRSLKETGEDSQPILGYLKEFIKVSHDEGNNGKGACIVLDGLDEYKSCDKHSLIYNLLQKKCLPKAMVVVSTRPSAAKVLQDLKNITRIQTFGFLEDQIIEYVKSFPFTDDSSEMETSSSYSRDLEKYLCDHSNVRSICHLPVHVAMICYLYKVQKGDIPQTQTKLYEKFTQSMILRHLRRYSSETNLSSLSELTGDFKINFETLCKLAFTMSVKHVQVITSNELKDIPSYSSSSGDEWCLGLLTAHHTLKSHGEYNEYAFLHLTFQEFLTAYYISRLTKAEQLAAVQNNKDLSSAIWIFFCGLLNTMDNEGLFSDVYDNIENDLSTYLSCAFESQQTMICDKIIRSMHKKLDFPSKITSFDIVCVNYVTSNTSEVVTEIDMPKSDTITLLQNIHEKHFSCLTKLEFYEELGEDKELRTLGRILELCTQLKEVNLSLKHISDEGARYISKSFSVEIRILRLSFSSCSEGMYIILSELQPHEGLMLVLTFQKLCKKGIAEMIAILQSNKLSRVHLNSLEISQCEVSSYNVSSLTNALQNCLALSTLSISESSVDSKNTELIMMSLSCLSFLIELDLSRQKIDDSGAVILATSVENLFLLESLNLCHNEIGADGAAAIFSVLPHMTNLIDIDLSYNNIGPTGNLFLLESLDLHHNEIGADGAAAIFSVLPHVTNLIDIDLSYNNIGPTGVVNLAIGKILHCVNKLDTIDLSHNNSGPRGDSAKLENFEFAIKNPTKLESIDLSYNDINSTEAMTLFTGLNQFTNLQKLYLSNNNLGDDGAAAISAKLLSLSELDHLDLSHNNIGPTGACSFATGLKHFSNLTYIDISNNSIGSEGANAIGIELRHFAKLHGLDLSYNNIKYLDVNMKKGLSHLTALRCLDFSNNCIDLDSALRVIQSLKCCNIHSADLSRSECSDVKCPFISVQGIVTKEDEPAIVALKAAAQHTSESRTLDLGFRCATIEAKELSSPLP